MFLEEAIEEIGFLGSQIVIKALLLLFINL